MLKPQVLLVSKNCFNVEDAKETIVHYFWDWCVIWRCDYSDGIEKYATFLYRLSRWSPDFIKEIQINYWKVSRKWPSLEILDSIDRRTPLESVDCLLKADSFTWSKTGSPRFLSHWHPARRLKFKETVKRTPSHFLIIHTKKLEHAVLNVYNLIADTWFDLYWAFF